MGGAVDNFNRLCPIKNEIDNKSSINHIGTAFFCKKDKPFEIPSDPIMTSPNGMHFIVTLCIYHDDEKFRISGLPILPSNRIQPGEEDLRSSELERITHGLMWSEIGWEINEMPGFGPRPSMTYVN